MVAFTIMTICDIANDQERFLLKPVEDEIFLTRIRLKDPRVFFLKAYLPLIEANFEFG